MYMIVVMGVVIIFEHWVTFPFDVIVFLLSLCLHMLSMYVWFCPHHDNPSPPAEGKQRRSYNAGPPVALPVLLLFLSLSVIITLTAPKRLKLDVCACAFVCCMGSTKGTLGGLT